MSTGTAWAKSWIRGADSRVANHLIISVILIRGLTVTPMGHVPSGRLSQARGEFPRKARHLIDAPGEESPCFDMRPDMSRNPKLGQMDRCAFNRAYLISTPERKVQQIATLQIKLPSLSPIRPPVFLPFFTCILVHACVFHLRDWSRKRGANDT